MFRIAVTSIFVSVVVFLSGNGQSTPASAAVTPRTELHTYLEALGRESPRFVRLKQQTRGSVVSAHTLGSMTLDMVTGDGPGPTMSRVRALVASLRAQSTGYEATALRLKALRAPGVLRADHALLVRALLIASHELARSAAHLDSTVRDGSVNVGTIKYFDGVMMRIPEADNSANAWRIATAAYAVRLGVTTPTALETFARVTPAP